MIRGLLCFAAMSLVLACEGGSRGPRVVVRDSAGIRIAENPSPDDSAANVWWTVSGPEVDIGSADAAEAYALHRVTDALRSPDGLIVVASAGTWDIRVYDSKGVHVRTTGRRGGGPGEFGSIGGLERGQSDSVLVPDPTNRRMSVLSPAGEFARETAMSGPSQLLRIFGRFSDGTLLGTIQGGGPFGLPTNGFSRPDVTLGRYSADGELVDTIGSFPGAERVINITASGGPITSPNQIRSIEIIAPPFAKNSIQAVFGSELYIGPQNSGDILVYDTDVVLRRIIRTGRVPDAVTEQHLEAQWQRSLEAAPPERQAEMRATGRPNRPHGNIVPPYAQLITDAAGNLWVSDYDDPLKDQQGRWTIYGPDGAVRARIVLPRRFRPYDIGADWILGQELDELDVEHVRLYRYAGGTGSR